MQSLLHIIEVEILIAIGFFLFSYVAVSMALRFLTGGRNPRQPESDRP